MPDDPRSTLWPACGPAPPIDAGISFAGPSPPLPPRRVALDEAERLLLAGLVRRAFVEWARLCPAGGPLAGPPERIACGFSAWLRRLERALGPDYRPRATGPGGRGFPLTGRQAHALANDLELDLAGPKEAMAAVLVACHCPGAQPEAGGRRRRAYRTFLARFGLDRADPDPDWREAVERLLAPGRSSPRVF